MSRFGRGSAGWWEVMRGECSSHFGSGRGRRCSVGFILRKKKAGRARAAVRGGAGQARPAGRLRPSGEGESGPIGKEARWPRLGQKPELGQSSRNKILSNFIWNLNFWQTLEICTMRFRRNFS
jgi:hypothetical protein